MAFWTQAICAASEWWAGHLRSALGETDALMFEAALTEALDQQMQALVAGKALTDLDISHLIVDVQVDESPDETLYAAAYSIGLIELNGQHIVKDNLKPHLPVKSYTHITPNFVLARVGISGEKRIVWVKPDDTRAPLPPPAWWK